METLKITLIAPPYRPVTPDYVDYGGIEVGVGNLAEYFDKKGHIVNLISSAGETSWQPSNGRLWAIGYSIEYLKGKLDPFSYWNMVKKIDILIDEIKKSDIVNNNDMKQAFSEIKIDHINENYISSLHTMDPMLDHVPEKTKIRLVTPSFQLQRMLTQLYRNRTFRTVYPGPVKKERYPFQKEKGDRLLYVGRLYKPKGAHRAIQIANKLKIPIDIVGHALGDDEDYVSYIKLLCRRSKYAKMHGHVSYEDKVKFYQNAKAVLIPAVEFYEHRENYTNVWVEPFGNITVEAGMCGTPSVVAPIGGWSETISDGVNGFYAFHNEEFYNAIEEIDRIDPNVCRERALYFDAEKGGERYLNLYRKVLDGDEW